MKYLPKLLQIVFVKLESPLWIKKQNENDALRNLQLKFPQIFETGNISDRDDKVMNVHDGLEEEPIILLLRLEVLQKFSLFSTNDEAVQADCLKNERNIE